jgi:hypothetical protein
VEFLATKLLDKKKWHCMTILIIFLVTIIQEYDIT